MTANAHRVEALVLRMQREFLETAGLRLTMPQAERRFQIDPVTCEALLGLLVDAKVLTRGLDGAYVRFLPRLAQAA